MLLVTESFDAAERKLRNILEHFGLQTSYEDTGDSKQNLERILTEIPVSTKRALMDYREKNAKHYLPDSLLFAETSGTTAKPLQIPRTRFDLQNGVKNYNLVYERIVRPNQDRVAFIHPSYLSPLRDITVRTLQDLNVGIMTLFPIPGLYTYDRIHGALKQNTVTTLVGSPSTIHQLLYNFQMLDLELPLSVDKILVTGEYFTEKHASNIKRLINRNCYVASIIFGANEIGMMMYGEDDFTYRGLAHDFIFECLPLENEDDFIHSSLPGAQTGELLVTSLTQSIMPVVRYATSDVFNFIPENDGTYRFQHIGRKDEYPINLRIRNLIDDALYSLQCPIFHYNLTVTRDGTNAIVQVLSPADLTEDIKHEIVDRITTITGDVMTVVIDCSPYSGGFTKGECIPKINRFRLAS